MVDEQPGTIDGELMLDVVTMMTDNARRVAATAVDGARHSAGDEDLATVVSAALRRETEAIVRGCPPENRALISAVRAAGHAIDSVATQALRTGVREPRSSLERAFDLFTSYVRGPGHDRITESASTAERADA